MKGKKTGGRTKGTPNRATVKKDEAREVIRQYLTDQLTPVADALLSRARGVRYFVTRHKRTGKYEIVTDPESVVAALNSEDDKTGEFYTDKPDVTAIKEILDRTLDKSKEQPREVEVTGKMTLEQLVLASRSSTSEGA